jgi:hypothetical protein
VRQRFLDMASEMDTTRSDTAPQCDAVATPTVQNSPIEETSTQDVVTPEGKDMPIEPTRPDIGPQSDAVVTSAVHDSTIEETSTQDVSSQVQDTSTEPTYSDTAPQSESIATLTVQDSPVGEISTQDVPQGIEIQPIQSASAITEVEKSDGVEKVALASPFDSPKPTAKNIRSETPKVAEEAADISDLPVDAQSSDKDELVEAISVVVNGHKEVRHVSGATDEAPKSSPTVHGLQKSKVRVHCVTSGLRSTNMFSMLLLQTRSLVPRKLLVFVKHPKYPSRSSAPASTFTWS